jgi:hypothetical protein
MTSLERELVIKYKETGSYDDEDILEACKDLSQDERVKLPLNEYRIRTELARYNLLKKVNNKREIKNKIKLRIEKAAKERIQELEQNPRIQVMNITTTLRAKYYLNYEDSFCIHKDARKVYAKVRKITHFEDIDTDAEEYSKEFIFCYCIKCGKIEYNENKVSEPICYDY